VTRVRRRPAQHRAGQPPGR